VQKPRPLVIVAGGEQMTLRAAARLADSCNISGGDIAEIRHKLAVLRGHCDAAGRDYDTIEKTCIQPWLLARDDAAVAAKRERLEQLETVGIRISMDGKGRFLDNVFIERLWRSLKYDAVFINARGSVIEARRGIGGWLSFDNDERPHQALGDWTPRAVFAGEACQHLDNPFAALRRCPHAHRHNIKRKKY
jgi:alkanesulfonate monooxygenase SsuD/methylene tetrahydromethanopterin reductase-like flavin-dependent oxidoreductase (luciferase family)